MAQPGFQTTFIPKREDARRRRTPTGGGVFTAVGMVILICTIVVAVGFFLYARAIASSIENKRVSLERSQAAFESGTVEQLADLDVKLMNAATLLGAHVAPSKMFALIERSTMQSVQFTDMSFDYDAQNGIVTVSLDGSGQSYASVALQSDRFDDNPMIQMPVFSNIRLNEGTGSVEFSVNFMINIETIQYSAPISPTTPEAETETETEPAVTVEQEVVVPTATDEPKQAEPVVTEDANGLGTDPNQETIN